jgi:starch synthase
MPRRPGPAAVAPHPPARVAAPVGVVHLTAEYWPFARTGGLGEAVSGLARCQAAVGMPTAVILPLYRQVRETTQTLERAGPPFTTRLGDRTETAWLYREQDGNAEGVPQVFFIEHPDFFDRAGIYGDDTGDYADNALRFAFFCKAALTILPHVAPATNVVHAHDWHAALAPVYLRTAFASDAFYGRLGAVMSVHNAGFQGHFAPETMGTLGLASELYDASHFEWYGRMNALKGGLAFSDMAVTVSPRHAHELLTAEGGFGLHDTFVGLGDRLVGILNGIDAEAWNPASDPHLPANYSADDLPGKRRCKAAMQRAYGLPQRAQTPLFGMSARLVSQKGLDLVLGANLMGLTDAQYVFLGAGEHRYHAALAALAAANPERVAVEFAFTDHLEHKLLAGADLLLMPSLYEPCGLTQMRAQRYGTIPVARRVGGLLDSITDGETGLMFDEYAPAALEQAVLRALGLYRDRSAWKALVQRAMGLPFGWEGSTLRYLDVYRRALSLHRAA